MSCSFLQYYADELIKDGYPCPAVTGSPQGVIAGVVPFVSRESLECRACWPISAAPRWFLPTEGTDPALAAWVGLGEIVQLIALHPHRRARNAGPTLVALTTEQATR